MPDNQDSHAHTFLSQSIFKRIRLKTVKVIFLLLAILLLPLTIILVKQTETHSSTVYAQEVISDAPVTKSVLLLIFNPVIESRNNAKLSVSEGWHDPDTLNSQIPPALKSASHDFVNYTIAERIEIDGWPVKQDGYVYTDSTYLQCRANSSTCHNPDIIDYQRLFNDYDICEKNVDEVWMWGGPYFGYWEYHPVTYCGETQFVMGFNYERAIGEALHDFGHRMEFVLSSRINQGIAWLQNESTAWNRFSKITGHCGNVHWPPGAEASGIEYHYGNTAQVTTDCNGYLNYPTGPFNSVSLNCTAWGCTQAGYMNWWLTRIPYKTGSSTDGPTGRSIYNNWWKYYAYFDETVPPTPTPTTAPVFGAMSAVLSATQASFSFTNTGGSTSYNVDLSTSPTHATDVYLNFGSGAQSPVVVTNPQAKWDKYTCGRTLYWKVYNANRSVGSPIQTAVVNCTVPTSTPTPTKTPTPLDTKSPTVSITAPKTGTFVTRNRTTVISAHAADTSGISRVNFYVNGSTKCSDTLAPYSCSWLVPISSGVIYNLTARAYDKKGNSALSTVVRVTSR